MNPSPAVPSIGDIETELEWCRTHSDDPRSGWTRELDNLVVALRANMLVEHRLGDANAKAERLAKIVMRGLGWADALRLLPDDVPDPDGPRELVRTLVGLGQGDTVETGTEGVRFWVDGDTAGLTAWATVRGLGVDNGVVEVDLVEVDLAGDDTEPVAAQWGTPRTVEDWAVLSKRLAAWTPNPDRTGMQAQIRDDIRAVRRVWPKRWDEDGWVPPARLRPADLLMIRGYCASMDITHDVAGETRRYTTGPGVGSCAAALLHGTPFWIPGRIAWGLARTKIPDPGDYDMRLPHEIVTVWFEQWLDLGGDEGMPAELAAWWDARLRDDSNYDVPIDTPWPMTHSKPGGTATSKVAETALAGVVLFSDMDSRPADLAIWVVATRTEGNPESGGRNGWTFTPMLGRPSQAGQRRLWWSLCALVAWGDWVRERPIVVRNRGKLKGLRGLDLTKIGPVRVMAARHTDSLGVPNRDEPSGTHASPATHIRRGHWRQQRVGRNRAGVELRWIAPVVVNPGNEGDWRETVLRLPPPESIPDTVTPDQLRALLGVVENRSGGQTRWPLSGAGG